METPDINNKIVTDMPPSKFFDPKNNTISPSLDEKDDIEETVDNVPTNQVKPIDFAINNNPFANIGQNNQQTTQVEDEQYDFPESELVEEEDVILDSNSEIERKLLLPTNNTQEFSEEVNSQLDTLKNAMNSLAGSQEVRSSSRRSQSSPQPEEVRSSRRSQSSPQPVPQPIPQPEEQEVRSSSRRQQSAPQPVPQPEEQEVRSSSRRLQPVPQPVPQPEEQEVRRSVSRVKQPSTRATLPPINNNNSGNKAINNCIQNISGTPYRKCSSAKFDPYFIWDGSFEYFNCTSLTKNKFGKWNLDKEEINQYFNGNLNENNIQVYRVTNDPLMIGFAATKNRSDKNMWKQAYENNPEFKKFVDDHNENVINYFINQGFSNIRDIYNEKISEYTSNENCKRNNETVGLNKEEKACFKKFPAKEGFAKQVISTNPCKVKYIGINDPNNTFIEEEEQQQSTNIENIIKKKREAMNDRLNQIVKNLPSDQEFVEEYSEEESEEEPEETVEEIEESEEEYDPVEKDDLKATVMKSIPSQPATVEESEESEEESEEEPEETNKTVIPPPPNDYDMNKEIELTNTPIVLNKKSVKTAPTPIKSVKTTPAKAAPTPITKSIKTAKTIETPVKSVKTAPTPMKTSSASVSKSINKSNSRSVKLDISSVGESDKVVSRCSTMKSSKFRPVSSVNERASSVSKRVSFYPENVEPIRRIAKKYATINRDGTTGDLLKDDQDCIDKYEIIRQFLIDTDTHIVKNKKSK